MTGEASDPSVKKNNNLKVVTVTLFAICNLSDCENYPNWHSRKQPLIDLLYL